MEAEAVEGGYQLCGRTAARTERDPGRGGSWKRPLDPLALTAFLYISLGTLVRPGNISSPHKGHVFILPGGSGTQATTHSSWEMIQG